MFTNCLYRATWEECVYMRVRESEVGGKRYVYRFVMFFQYLREKHDFDTLLEKKSYWGEKKL